MPRDQDLSALPTRPGVYLMKDAEGAVLYVGKAANLRTRVRSYFQPGADHGPRIAVLVRRVAEVDVRVTASEVEALVLEATLVKEHQPRYNVRLRDDKHFPYLKLTAERFPQMVECRAMEPDGGRYFGPYTDAGAMRRADKLVRRLFHVRSCTFELTGEPQMRPCLDHHLGLCDAPCAGLISAGAYARQVEQAAQVLAGRADDVIERLSGEMSEAAAALEFERAAELRDLIASLRKLTAEQRVVSTSRTEADVLAVAQHEDLSCVQVFFVRDGRVTGDQRVILEGALDALPATPLRSFILRHYADGAPIPRRLLLPAPVEDQPVIALWLSELAGRKVELLVPERGERRRLVELVQANAAESLRRYLTDRDQQRQRSEAAVSDLRERLDLPRTPFRIECFDIATLHGRESVGSMVVLDDGRPLKSAYRRFRIRHESDEANDYAMMREVLTRRLERARAGDAKFLPLPDLLLVDGGQGQLNVAVDVCSGLGFQQLPLAALAKRHEHLYLPGRREPVVLDARMPALRLLRALRDEAHRFANTFHQRLRRGQGLTSILDEIPGVGPRRRTLLLEHFRGTEALRAASVDDIAALPGLNRRVAEAIKHHLAEGDGGGDGAGEAPVAE